MTGDRAARDRIDALEALLVEAGKAHGRYEETELQGVYDQGWPSWYAAYAVEHGIGALIGHAISAEQLAPFFASSNGEYEGAASKATETWAAYTARRIAAEL